IACLADVRSLPGSRYVSHFDRENLETELPKAGIEYQYFKDLGGRRKPLPESENKNLGWRNTSFRGYADYMQTEDFENALGELIEKAKQKRTAIMCAEAVPWRCHRSLIADALLVRGFSVQDIFPSGETKNHTLTPFARTDGTQVLYPRTSA
ncbi:MAG TPA: DUF488 domain-containing protein, partial [Candidatus Paceibacterota bacterium]|nr:DUF488 domain-containing protein [Candidatus Paceibacterota bacterium]